MFFDDVEEIAVAFQPLLLEIALIQKKMYTAVHRGTDQENLSRLNKRREQLQQQLRAMNQTEQGSRYYWWDQQWDVLVNRLQEDTGLKGDCGEDADGWEWEEMLHEEQNDGLHQLILLEQARKAGHVVLRDSWGSGTRSRYSAEDEQTMIDQHNKRIFDNVFIMDESA